MIFLDSISTFVFGSVLTLLCVFPSFFLFSAPVFDYEDIPSPLSESESTITVLLRPALARGAPVRYN